MTILARFRRFLAEYSAIMGHAHTGRPSDGWQADIASLPPEVRRDLGQPDARTAHIRGRARQDRW